MKKRLLPVILLGVIACWIASGQTYTISTFAGGALPVNVPGTSASLYAPGSVAFDKGGNIFFTLQKTSASSGSPSVLRLDAITGVVTLVAGNGTPGFSGDDGPATSAQLNQPLGIAVDSVGNLYIADAGNNRIRKVSNGVITSVAGNGTQGFSGDNGPATGSQLNFPKAVTVDPSGDLYIADTGNYRIRKISNGVITTVAGSGGCCNLISIVDSGAATGVQIDPDGVALDSSGNLYIADSSYNLVSEVSNGAINTVAGTGIAGFGADGGPATSAELSGPVGVAVDSAGNLYIADAGNNRIRRVSNGVITTVAGNGTQGFSGDNGPALSAELNSPFGVAVDSAGNLCIADSGNNRIRKVSNSVITTMAGNNGVYGFSGDNGSATSAQLSFASAVAVDSAGNLYIADYNRIRKVSNGVITTVAGNGTQGFSGDNGPATSAQLGSPEGVAVDPAGNLYIADERYDEIRKVANGVITTAAGKFPVSIGVDPIGDNGPATSAELNGPIGVAVDSASNLYIADSSNQRIRKVANGVITTVAGNGASYGPIGDNGPATSAELNFPEGVAVDSVGNLYIADYGNRRIREVSNGVITTIAGNGTGGFSGDGGPATSASLSRVKGIAVDAVGNLYIADTDYNRVRKVSNGVITTVAGNGSAGFSGDNGPSTAAELNGPVGVAVDSAGNVYVADSGNDRIRVLTPGTVPAITTGGVVPVYSSVPIIQPGSWVSIYGIDLASGTTLWNGNFPTSLGGTSVNIDNKPAYLWFVSPTQINLQVPDDNTTGTVSVAVTTAFGTKTSTVTLAPYGPSFSLLGDGKHVAAEIATPNGTGAYGGGTYDLVGPSNTFSYRTRPVKAGETLTLYGVGFGPTTPPVPAGQVFSGSAPTNAPVTITIGGMNAPVAFAGITEAGLYQINVTVPSAPSGDQPLSATDNGVQTPTGPVVTVQ